MGSIVRDTLSDLNFSLSLAGEEINRLQGYIDAMTLLEPRKREFDIRTLADWYYRYSDLLRDMRGRCEDRLESLRDDYRGGGDFVSLYADLAATNGEAKKDLQEMIRKYESELQRLFRLIDRRRFLAERVQELRGELSEVEEQKAGTRGPEKSDRNRRERQLKKELNVLQTEVLSLYDIREELLKHYVVMIEMARDEAFQLDLGTEQFRMLGELAGSINRLRPKDHASLERALGRTVSGYEAERRRIGRKIDELDRKASGISPAGSYRDLDRSRELSDFYADRKERYRNYMNRIDVREGSLDAARARAGG
jgi:hypothetical protein